MGQTGIQFNNGVPPNQQDTFLQSILANPAVLPDVQNRMATSQFYFSSGPVDDYVLAGLTAPPGNPNNAGLKAPVDLQNYINSLTSMPTTWAQFYTGWVNSNNLQFFQPTFSPGTDPTRPFLIDSVTGLCESLGILPQSATIPNTGNANSQAGSQAANGTGGAGGDWFLLSNAVDPSTHNAAANPPINMNAQFQATFAAFLKQTPLSAIQGGVFGVNLLNTWSNFTATTCTLMQATTANPPFQGMPSYEQIYYSFHPGASQTDFLTSLVGFYNGKMATDGYFLPSQSLSDWVVQNINQYNEAVTGSAPFSTVTEDQASILNRIIALLISMITTMQQIGVVQAKQLNFLTAYQNIYTQMQTQVPTFIQGDKIPETTVTSPLGQASQTASTERSNLNTAFNTSKTQNLQALRGVQEDYAKQVQSYVNQTNDTVNQQTDMATQLIQQLNDIVSTIFR